MLEGGHHKPDLIKALGPEPITPMCVEAPPVVMRAGDCDGQRGKQGLRILGRSVAIKQGLLPSPHNLPLPVLAN